MINLCKKAVSLTTILALLVSIAIIAPSNVQAAEMYNTVDELIVKFKSSVDENVLKKHNMKVKKKGRKNKISSINIPKSKSVSSAMLDLKNEPSVEYVERNFKHSVTALPNDEIYDLQWGLAAIDAEKAWDTSYGSSGVVVAIIDTGVQLNHPDLTGNIVPGFNTITNSSNANDDNGHGTHVAGIAAGVANNGIGISGLAGNCKIMPVKALDQDGSGYTIDIAEAIVWAADNGANVINLSLGSSFQSQYLQEAVNYAYNKGAVIVAAAGNSNVSTPFYPAACNNVISVAAIDDNIQKAYFSNYGSTIDIAAPGVDILSTFPINEYAFISGTSQASPFVAGACALLKSIKSTYTPAQIENVLTSNAVDLGQPGKDNIFGYGLLDIGEAVEKSNQTSSVSLSASQYTVREGEQVTVTVNRTGYTQNRVQVNYATSNTTATQGADYISQNGTLTFEPNETSKNIVINSVDDSQVESSETFSLSLSSPVDTQFGAISSAVISITDNDVQLQIKSLVPDLTSVKLKIESFKNIKLNAMLLNSTSMDVTNSARWVSANPSIATVDSSGKITAVMPGRTTITATHSGKTSNISVITDVRLSTTTKKGFVGLNSSSNTFQLKLNALYADGTTEDVSTKATWSSANETVATVSNSVVTAVGAGTTTVTATFYGLRLDYPIDTNIKKIVASQKRMNVRIGASQSVSILVTHANNTVATVTEGIEWSSSNDSIATVSNGVITAVESGTAVIKAKYMGKEAFIDVNTTIKKIIPQATSVNKKIGDNITIRVNAMYADGSLDDVTSFVEWTSTNPSVVGVQNGIITALDSGKTPIIASYKGKNASVTINSSLTSITPMSKALTMRVNQTRNITINITYADRTIGSTSSGITLSSTNQSVATADQNGVITAVGVGRCIININYKGKTSQITLNVN